MLCVVKASGKRAISSKAAKPIPKKVKESDVDPSQMLLTAR